MSEPPLFLSIAQYIAWEEDIFKEVANDVEIKVVKMSMTMGEEDEDDYTNLV